MGAGVLPVAFTHSRKTGRLTAKFLFSRERVGSKSRASGQWSDFGGRPEAEELPIETAAREASEESMGILGTPMEILEMLQGPRKIGEVRLDHNNRNSYVTYLLEIDYDETLPLKFKNLYESSSVDLRGVNGLFEKDRAMWVDTRFRAIKDLSRSRGVFQNEIYGFRRWYTKIALAATGVICRDIERRSIIEANPRNRKYESVSIEDRQFVQSTATAK